MSIYKLVFVITVLLISYPVFAQFPEIEIENDLDIKVKSFLEENADNWRDMNIPLSDGKLMYDIIIKNNYKNAVEIGTSTGHSAIWIAWALSKTGGKLITIEIDKKRYMQAKANFKKSGVSKFILTRLADAHELVPKLPGEYDFVFSDADIFWYKKYFMAMDPKLKPGGCFIAHNTLMQSSGIKKFLVYIEGLQNYKTTMDYSDPSGLSISYKKDK